MSWQKWVLISFFAFNLLVVFGKMRVVEDDDARHVLGISMVLSLACIGLVVTA